MAGSGLEQESVRQVANSHCWPYLLEERIALMERVLVWWGTCRARAGSLVFKKCRKALQVP